MQGILAHEHVLGMQSMQFSGFWMETSPVTTQIQGSSIV